MSGPKEKQAMTKSAFIKEVHDAEAMLYHVAKSILKNDADCCDAVQETLLKAYEKLDTLKKEKFFRTWITRILINECNGIIRKRKNIIPYEEYMENAQMFEENRYDHLYMAIMEFPYPAYAYGQGAYVPVFPFLWREWHEQKPKPIQTQSLSHPRKAGLSVSVPYIFRLLLHTAVSRWKLFFSAEASFSFKRLLSALAIMPLTA